MGPSLHNGEPAMATNGYDWRTQLPSDARQKIVNKIMATVQKHLPFSGPEGINELRRIAARFEEKIFSGAVNQTDYLRTISMKMLTMEAGSSSSLLIPDANNSLAFDLGPGMATTGYDWRTQLPSDSRQKIVNKIMATVQKHLPFSGPEGINELRRIAARFEEKIFSGAVNQTDYLRTISMKMLTMEAGSSSSLPIPDANDNLAFDLEPAINSGDWRTQLPPDSRQKNVDQLIENLKNHVPYSGQEGFDELRRIAISFEELIFNTAINQVDYFRKISLKMQSMEEGD